MAWASDGTDYLADDCAADYCCGGDVLVLRRLGIGQHAVRHGAGTYCFGDPVCGDYRDRTLTGFDARLLRAAASLGANPVTTFRRVTLPMILPGMVSGGIFAFVTSFDEVVVALFLAGSEQRTLPRQMWSGIREQLSPTILAAATLLVLFSIKQ